MRRCIAFLFVSVFLLFGSNVALAFDLSNMSDDELVALAESITQEQIKRKVENSEYLISGNFEECFVGLKNSYIKDGIFYLVFDFFHSSDDAKAFATSINCEVFQNGVECDIAFGGELTDAFTKVKKGVTIEVLQKFELSSDEPVEVEIKYLYSFINDEKIMMTLPVK